MNRDELIHYICNKITTLDDEAHYVYDERRGVIEKYVDGYLIDYVKIK